MAKRPRDANQLAKLIVDIATGEAADSISSQRKNPQIKRGRPGGLKGGKARALSLSKSRRQAISRKAANARWKPRRP